MRRVLSLVVAALFSAFPGTMLPQAASAPSAPSASDQNAQKARVALDAMVKALGGDAWLNIQNQMTEGHIAAFFQGRPDLGTTEVYEYHQWPDHDRTEVTKHRDVIEFYVGRAGWEVTYKGKAKMQQDLLDDYLRRRDRSIETAVKVWMKDPNTILVYEGQRLAERHLAEQVTLISPQNESVTILMDSQTHLPLRRVFEWRDPTYHDKNTDAEEYDDYHVLDGIQTPYAITRFKNDEMFRQLYVTKVQYNQPVPADFWNPDAAAQKVKK
jgi:hypothetical protein